MPARFHYTENGFRLCYFKLSLELTLLNWILQLFGPLETHFGIVCMLSVSKNHTYIQAEAGVFLFVMFIFAVSVVVRCSIASTIRCPNAASDLALSTVTRGSAVHPSSRAVQYP